MSMVNMKMAEIHCLKVVQKEMVVAGVDSATIKRVMNCAIVRLGANYQHEVRNDIVFEMMMEVLG